MEMMRLGQQKVFGQVRLVDASLGYKMNQDPEDWHLKKALSGGGPLTNLGVYCVQAARYITGEEPISVTAQFGPNSKPEVFKEVEESITWQLNFASGAVGTGTTSYNYGIDRLYASADDGYFELSPAISYGPFKGGSHLSEFNFPTIDQQQTQMDMLAPYYLTDQPMPDHISGYEGLRDLKVMDAIYKAARSQKTVLI
jgi:predicted dehydrogenase